MLEKQLCKIGSISLFSHSWHSHHILRAVFALLCTFFASSWFFFFFGCGVFFAPCIACCNNYPHSSVFTCDSLIFICVTRTKQNKGKASALCAVVLCTMYANNQLNQKDTHVDTHTPSIRRATTKRCAQSMHRTASARAHQCNRKWERKMQRYLEGTAECVVCMF